MVFVEKTNFTCDCGNPISYTETIFEGGRDKDDELIMCENCGNEMTLHCDNLGGLKGAVRKIPNTPTCPYCNLTPEKVERMNEKEAGSIVLEMNLEQCCLSHLKLQADIRSSKSLMGKSLLKAIVLGNI